MTNETFDKEKFINDLIKDLNLKNETEETLNMLKNMLSEKLDKYLLGTLFDSLGTGEIRALNALKEKFPEAPMPLILLMFSRTIPDLQEKIRLKSEEMKKEILYLMQKIREPK